MEYNYIGNKKVRIKNKYVICADVFSYKGLTYVRYKTGFGYDYETCEVL